MIPQKCAYSKHEIRVMTFLELIKLARPKQWTKNLFVFASLIFSRNLFHYSSFLNVLLAFIAFSLISSSVYVLNDIIDIEKDQLHPNKKFRPLAAGKVTVLTAAFFGCLLFLTSIVLSLKFDLSVMMVLLAYAVFNLCYSMYLKHFILIDVFVIAIGFVLRVLAGSYAISIIPSVWILFCTLLLSLFLGFCKRKSELLLLESCSSSHRKILDNYSHKLLDQLIILLAGLCIVSYTLYTCETRQGVAFFLTIPIVIYALFRYLFLVYENNDGGEPANILLGDRPFLLCCLLWGIMVLLIFYVPSIETYMKMLVEY